MKEQWQRYEPRKNLAEKYDIESVYHADDNLQIVLSDFRGKSDEIMMSFKQVYSYRSVEEAFSLELFAALDDAHKGNFYGNWTFFKVINSDYVKWLIKESNEQDLCVIHFVLISIDFVVDIVAFDEPIVTPLNTKITFTGS